MPSPFPGMDPYLENPELWPEVHSRLIVALADDLAPTLLPDYYVAIEKRTYVNTLEDSVLIGVPDVSILSQQIPSPQTLEPLQRPLEPTTTLTKSKKPQIVTIPVPEEVQERYLEIRETQTGTVVTVIELLSPKNKRMGPGREAYLKKRQQVFMSTTHLVEIDLLRGGTSLPLQGSQESTDYRILVSHSHSRPQAQLYGFNLEDDIPPLPLPLTSTATEPMINLKSNLDGIYDRAGYRFRIDYSQPPTTPSLSTEKAAWVTNLLTQNALR